MRVTTGSLAKRIDDLGPIQHISQSEVFTPRSVRKKRKKRRKCPVGVE
jgi:hypothetical protein